MRRNRGVRGVLSPGVDGIGGGVKRRRIQSGQFVRWIDGVYWRSSRRCGRVAWSFCARKKRELTSGPEMAVTQTHTRTRVHSDRCVELVGLSHLARVTTFKPTERARSVPFGPSERVARWCGWTKSRGSSRSHPSPTVLGLTEFDFN